MIFQINEEVFWNDPDAGLSSGFYKISGFIDKETILITNEDTEAEVPVSELEKVDLNDPFLDAKRFCNQLDLSIGEGWSNDYIILPEKMQEYAEWYHKKQLNKIVNND